MRSVRHTEDVMSKYLLIASIITVLTGCAMFPQTEGELITNGNKSEPLCFSEPKDVVEARIKSYLAQCFKPDFVFTSGVSGYNLNHRVKESKTEQSTIYNVYTPSGSATGYFLNVKIDQTNKNCTTTVNVVGLNMFWEKEFEKITDAVAGKSPSCSM
jgi:hypothetical protein